MTSSAPSSWQPHPDLPPKQAEALREAVASLPPSHLLPPSHGEEFPSGEEAVLRLHNYAFAHGYCLVGWSGSIKAERLRLVCKHHGSKTRNYRKTTEEEREEVDEKGRHIRRPHTKVAHTNCTYLVYVSYRPVVGGGGRKGWQIGVSCNEHTGHNALPDPFAYPEHQSRYPRYPQMMAEALDLRATSTQFSKVKEILESKGLPSITAKDYRNLERTSGPPRTSQQRFQDLLQCLQAEDFRIKESDIWKVDPFSGTRQKVLDQIVFASTEQVDLARRFASGFVMVIDATFQTNEKNLLLSVCTAITNTGKTFPVCFSFQASEAKVTFDLTWEFLDHYVFHDIEGPAVIVGDQAAGFVSSMADRKEIMQLCQWHAVENMRKRLITHGYCKTKEDVEFWRALLWNYVKASTEDDLKECRADLLKELQFLSVSTWLLIGYQRSRALLLALPSGILT